MSQIYFIGVTLYMFRTVFPPIIMSSRLYILEQAYVRYCKQTAVCQRDTAVSFLASKEQYLFEICLLMYVQS